MKRESIFVGICLSLLASSSSAVSLRDSVETALNNNPDIIAERKNQEAYRKYVDEREGRYLPTIDLEAYLSAEKERIDRDNVSGNGTWQKDEGYNAAIIFRQYIYDGGLTPAQVAETKFQEGANKHRSLYAIENAILETVKSYTSLVQFDERLALSSDMIKTHEENLVTAKQKEEISGEVLETYQVASKLHFVTDSYIEEQDLKDTAIANYVKYVGIEPDSAICRPIINENKIPQSLKEAIEIAVLKNHRILEQIQVIKRQREKIAQMDATFLPNLNLELKASFDEDLENSDAKTEDQYARLNLNWNLFNGNRDNIRSEQEEVFLQEHKKTLEEITNDVVAQVKSTYGKYFKNKQRIEALKKYVNANVNIVEVYKNEFEAGTRTFVDILDAESELYSSSKGLINMEHAALNNYYDLMFNLSMLSDAILASSNQNCSNVKPRQIDYIPEIKVKNTSNELAGLISDTQSDLLNSELGLVDTSSIVDNKNTMGASDMKSFLDAPKSYFTINVATKRGLSNANKYIEENNLGNSAYAFSFGPKMKSAKVLYGVFSSVKEAKKVLKTFTPGVLASKPYIDNIRKHQALYSKYN